MRIYEITDQLRKEDFMKTTKSGNLQKILSIALCLMLLCNIFTVVVSAADGLITIKMYDTTSDTWDGSQLQVYENGILIATVEKKASGAEEIWTYEYNPLADYSFKWVKGIWLWETSFDILVNGELKFSATTTDCQNYEAGQEVFSLKSSCTHSIEAGSVECSICGKRCGVDFEHVINTENFCDFCKNACGSELIPHDCSNDDGICAGCGASCSHVYEENGFCSVCDGYEPAQQVSASHYSELNETHNGYYAIENAGQLYWFAKQVDNLSIGNIETTGTTYKYHTVTVNAVLINDIAVNQNVLAQNGELNDGNYREWTPIGYSNTPYVQFSGVFDGNNKTIRGLVFDHYETSSNNKDASGVGLFAYITNPATIKDTTIIDSYFAGYQNVGAFVGATGRGGVKNSRAIVNCVSKATIKGNSKSGGIAGQGTLTITDCRNEGKVYVHNQGGGIIGSPCYSAIITNTVNTGDVVSIESSAGVYIGGFAGYVDGRDQAEFKNCYNIGDLIISNTNQTSSVYGGFFGQCANALTVENCYNYGKVQVTGTSYDSKFGSFAGSLSGMGTVSNCYYNTTDAVYGAVSNADYTGITGKDSSAFSSGEVAYLLQQGNTEQVWGQDSNQTGAVPILDSTGLYKVVTVGETGNYSVANVGDTNGDGTVDVTDYQALVNKALADDHQQIETANYDDIIRYDLDGDGYLDVIDASLMHLFINGFTTIDVYAVGDYDLNGVAFEEADLSAIKHAIEKPEKLSTAEKYACDINGDGKVSEADLTELNAIYGEIDSIEHTFLGEKCKICGLNKLNIADISKTVYFNDNDNKLDLSTLFTLPDGAGNVTYEFVSGSGNLDGSTLNIVLQGTEKIKVTVAETETHSADEFEITVTVEAPKGSGSFIGPWVTIG